MQWLNVILQNLKFPTKDTLVNKIIDSETVLFVIKIGHDLQDKIKKLSF